MSIPVCKFYSCNRNCKFGQHCRFLHCTPSESSSIISSDQPHDGNLDQGESKAAIPRLSSSYQPPQTQDETLVEVGLPASSPPDIELNNSTGKEKQFDIQNDKTSKRVPNVDYHRSRPVCIHFTQHGWCKFGRNCRFSHPKLSQQINQSNPLRNIAPRFQKKNGGKIASNEISCGDQELGAISNEDTAIKADETASKLKEAKITKSKSSACKYFQSGHCYKGSKCLFVHQPVDGFTQAIKGQSKNTQVPSKGRSAPRRIIKPPGQQQILSFAEVDQFGTHKYRQLEISFLKKRFQCQDGDYETEDFVTQIEFCPSDPDWPFDMRSFLLEITLPVGYPAQAMCVKVPADKQELPESVRRYLEGSLSHWLNDRHGDAKTAGKVELVARPFFKWLDRAAEDLVTEGLTRLKKELTARAAGLEFITVEELKSRIQISQPAAEEEEEEDDDGREDESSDECLESDSDSNDSSSDSDRKCSVSTNQRGTEITLKFLQLKQNACALMLSKLALMVQCSRCKTTSSVSLDETKVVAIECAKCGQQMMTKYRPSLAHAMSSVVGYLDLENCVAFDLVLQDSTMVISCLSCSKSTSINGLMTGQMTDSWCKACNAKFKVATEAVKFYRLEPSTVISTGHQVERISTRKKKLTKDPAIREGFALPEEGTCRHYKQSYRWLRFPCCGKAYPCDVCHDKKEDHPMDMATRMICGHCSREQNFSATRPCISCGGHMTKVKSSHWEGGSGCRDKIAMSRGDQQKYKNMNKTQSNHSKKVKAAASGKKSTKLRHS